MFWQCPVCVVVRNACFIILIFLDSIRTSDNHRQFMKAQQTFRFSTTECVAACLWLMFCLQTPANASVTTRIDARNGTIVIENGMVEVAVRNNGDLVRVARLSGPNLLHGQVGYWQANVIAEGNSAERPGQFVRLDGSPHITNSSDEEVEIAVTREATRNFPFRASLHYVVRDQISGFYVFMTIEHTAGMGGGFLEQLAYNIRLDPNAFDFIAASDDRKGGIHSGKDEAPNAQVMDATYRLPDGRVVSKYDYVVDMARGEQRVCGWAGREGGVWLVQPSGEYITGAPMAQLMCAHQTRTSPIIVWQPHSRHFGTTAIVAAGTWQKIFGPVLWYVNTGSNSGEMWDDANWRARNEEISWPYRWLQHPFYSRRRGEVRGRLSITDGTRTSGGLVFLAKPGGDWYRTRQDYVASGRVGSDGLFTIRNAVPGTYALYAIVPGVFGEFQHEGVIVAADTVTELRSLAWNPVTYGRRLWQIGVPDHSAAEFRNGQQRHWGNWQFEYPEQFPNGVNFVVGESRENVDWNYLHPIWAPPRRVDAGDEAAEQFFTRSPVWRIYFDLKDVPSGTAYLQIAFAGMRNAKLKVEVNGSEVGRADLPYNDSAAPRGAARGAYWETVIKFDGSRMIRGRNVISLAHANPVQVRIDPTTKKRTVKGDIYAGILYDSIRLEVGGR
jgi:rhamnogalacturonan endolyase